MKNVSLFFYRLFVQPICWNPINTIFGTIFPISAPIQTSVQLELSCILFYTFCIVWYIQSNILYSKYCIITKNMIKDNIIYFPPQKYFLPQSISTVFLMFNKSNNFFYISSNMRNASRNVLVQPKCLFCWLWWNPIDKSIPLVDDLYKLCKKQTIAIGVCLTFFTFFITSS